MNAKIFLFKWTKKKQQQPSKERKIKRRNKLAVFEFSSCDPPIEIKKVIAYFSASERVFIVAKAMSPQRYWPQYKQRWRCAPSTMMISMTMLWKVFEIEEKHPRKRRVYWPNVLNLKRLLWRSTHCLILCVNWLAIVFKRVWESMDKWVLAICNAKQRKLWWLPITKKNSIAFKLWSSSLGLPFPV